MVSLFYILTVILPIALLISRLLLARLKDRVFFRLLKKIKWKRIRTARFKKVSFFDYVFS